ncbi:hypothetical protein CYMTET_44710 [Cymbomonas tetramitiformis]|uniref:Ammonium transporter AmtB-like domain-containing protein n=1 Tax=Cymbomonas tetramitiformis TaxID=36881 RepID=A0AAE0EZ21_9CHLO|nr:hypothetical protein CYMTET_44711 [Cymbomonas tetramitiformis]KAK3245739.1 hypothetical protein CYMTET_44710 [Cymbomonas tetramitiformis]
MSATMSASMCYRPTTKVQGHQNAVTTPIQPRALRPRSSALRRTALCSKSFKSLSNVAPGQNGHLGNRRFVCRSNEFSKNISQEEHLPKENVALETETAKNTDGKTNNLFKALQRSAMVCAAVLLAATATPAMATTGVVAADTAWVLTSTALVLFMTLPGLAAFYAGLVKRKNLLSVLMQCFAIACIQTVLWAAVGYSLSFSTVGMEEGVRGLASFVGGLDKAFLSGISMSSVTGTIPEALWVMFQMTFAIITPALMVGSVVERMKFNAVMIYSTLWSIFVYFPFCHMVWGGAGGLMADLGVLDFAGGIVVHITAGIGALVAAIVCGPRKDNQMASGNLTLTFLGTGMLWVGWFGFNGGSAAAAGDPSTSSSFLV